MKIALFANRTDLVVASGLALGFRQAGSECNLCLQLLSPAELANFCQIFKPDAVMEINRIYQDELPIPKPIRHICWMQDHRFMGELLVRRPSVSDLTYAIIEPRLFGITARPLHHLDVLMPGVNSDVYFPAERAEQSVFSFIGFLPAPYPRHRTLLIKPDGTTISIKQFIDMLPPTLLLDTHFDIEAIHREVRKLAERLVGYFPEEIEQDMGLFDEVAVRTIERADIIRRAMALAMPLRLFGPDFWTLWPEFRSSYRGYLSDPTQIRDAYQSTRINLHNGSLAIHYRTVDCMASGRAIMVKDTPYDYGPAGMRKYFEPGEHYFAFSDENFEEVAREAISNHEHRERIGSAAHKAVMASHTWRHRADQIIGDLRRL